MRVLIVGAVAGGATAAARIRRLDEQAEIVVFERGEYVSFANCGLAYYIGGEIEDRDKLLVTPSERLHDRYGIDVRLRTEVKRIVPDVQEVEVEDLTSGDRYRERYDKLLLATGAAPVRPPLPGIDSEGIFALRTIPDADAIKGYIERTRASRAVIVGAGFIGLEMAENLRRLGMEVTVVELLDQVMPPLDPEMAALVAQELRLNRVELRLGVPVSSFSRDDAGLHVHLKDGGECVGDLAVLSIGVKPEAALAKEAGLRIGERGGIVTDEHMTTSAPNIYAAGDAVEAMHLVEGKPTHVALGGPANRQARVAADNICGRDSRYRRTQGTAIVRVFDLAVACTGSNEKSLQRLGMPHEKCYVQGHSHATYYPGAENLAIKLLFAPADGRILGAQVVGGEGTDTRIDVLATALRAGMSVYDLEHLELAYAPQYGSARDPVNTAGMAAANMLRRDAECVHWHQVDDLLGQGHMFVDVQTPEEHAVHSIPGAVNIPVDGLRDRMGELPKDKPIVVYCSTGLRSYVACRALKQSGFQDVKNLNGGFGTYGAMVEAEAIAPKEAGMSPPEHKLQEPDAAAVKLDACGLQCPGPIVQLNKKVQGLKPGEVLEVSATDMGFARDLPAWCARTGFEVLSVEKSEGKIVGRIRKPGSAPKPAPGEPPATNAGNDKTIIVFSNDLDRAMAAFVIANGAAAMGRAVTMFFTFWGLNVLRKRPSPSVSKGLLDRMFGWMMPKGAGKLTLSKMHMAGMGTAMMKMVMRQKGVQSLPELIELAKEQGVRMIACTMTMDIMGIRREELIDGIEEAGVATYLAHAETSDTNLFI